MAVYFAQKSGNISANDVFFDAPSGGNAIDVSVVCTASDILSANSYTIALDEDVTALRLSTADEDAGGAGVAGGGFTVAGTRTITANILSGTTLCLNASGSGYTITVTGNVTGGTSASARGVYSNTAITILVSGTITGGSADSAFGLYNGSTGAVTAGNVTGGSGASCHGIVNNTSGAITVTGLVTGGSGASTYARGIAANSTGTLTLNDVIGGSGVGCNGVYLSSSCTVTISGTVTGGSAATGLVAALAATVTIANVIGGSAASIYGVTNVTTGVINITNVTAGSAALTPGIYNASTGVVTITGNIINNTSSSAVHGQILYHPASGAYIQYPKTTGGAGTYKYPQQLSIDKVKSGTVHGDLTGDVVIPAITNVRTGITYDSTSVGQKTGDVVLPAVANVLDGVLYDSVSGGQLEGTAIEAPSASAVASAAWAYATRTLP